ncbi:flavin reductase family protein [Roseivirga seohaensis]|uniref:flavin reductase family protein n=1 Tax=Roseivirga seohaensis TaxID=1914963 RepID=UPI003BACCE8E
MQLSSSDILKLEQRFRTNLINCLSGFKTPHLIGTKSKLGITNLGLFTQVMHIGANPPLMGVLFRPHSVPRHTLENILETKEYTINLVHKAMMEQAHWTSARWEKSEFEATGLTEYYSNNHFAPFVAESKIKIGLKFKEQHLITANKTILVIGEIKELIIEEELITSDGFLNIEAANTLAMTGLDSYHDTNSINRLAYAKPDIPPKRLD